MRYIIHEFLKVCFRNTNKSKVLNLRIREIFYRDALEGRLNLEVQRFSRNFRKEVC